MALGERFELDEITRLGDPWHGVWRGATNKITTIPGPQVTCPGTAPAAGQPTRRHGECYLVEAPSMPTTSSDSADAAAGRSWLSYGLLAGANHRLYGVDLGADAWIYVASDGTRWLARFTVLDVTSGTAQVELQLTQFGVFGATAAPIQQTINFGMVALNLNAASPNDFYAYSLSHNIGLEIEDIWKDGSKVLLAASIGCIAIASPRVDARVLFTVLECQITGIPPAANVGLVTVLTQAQVGPAVSNTVTKDYFHFLVVRDQAASTYLIYTANDSDTSYDWAATLASAPAHDYYATGDAIVGYAETYAQNVVVGVRYSAAGAMSVLRRVETHSRTYSATITPYGGATWGWSGEGNDDSTGKVSLTRDGTELHKVDLINNGSQTGSDTAGTYIWSQTVGAQSASESGPTPSGFVLSVQLPQLFVPGRPGAIMSIFYKQVAALKTTILFPLRYTNTIYGMVGEELSSASPLRFYPVFGKAGSDESEVAWSSGNVPLYCTEHPVTGVIVRDTSPVAFV